MKMDDITASPVIVGAELRQIVERIERLEEEKRQLATDIKEVFAEAKGRGFDTKILRACIKYRAKDPNERSEERELLDVYLEALGDM
jgi:uncharacterized protein (UPF0335 family)